MDGLDGRVDVSLAVPTWRVQAIHHPDGRRSYLIVQGSTGVVNQRADRFLRSKSPGTQSTYGYRLVEFFNWRDAHGLLDETLTIKDLERFMNSIGTEVDPGPLGLVGVTREEPLSSHAQSSASTAIKGYFLDLFDHEKVNEPLRDALIRERVGVPGTHGAKTVETNPIAPKKVNHRARLLPDQTWEALAQPGVLLTARDRMIVTWLYDAGLRVGELCGLRFCDLHLRQGHPCLESRHTHIHVVKREDNPNGARAKTAGPPLVGPDGIVRGGTIRRVSPEMLSAYWEYLTEDYHRARALADHDMVLVTLEQAHLGDAMTTKAVRAVVADAGQRAGLGRLRPHAFRHRWATEMLRLTGNSTMTAQAGGWASASTVENTYAHLIDTPELEQALGTVWRRNPLV